MEPRASPFQLVAQKLVTSLFEANPGWVTKSPLSVDFKVESKRFPIEGEPHSMRVQVTFTINEDKELPTVPFQAVIVVYGIFKWQEGIAPELIEKLLATNAPAALMSYIRPVLSFMTSYAGFPTLIIPLLDFTPSGQEVKQQDC